MPKSSNRRGKVAARLVLVAAMALAVMIADTTFAAAAGLKTLKRRISVLYRAGKYDEAIPLAREFTKRLGAKLGNTHPAYLAALHAFANLLIETNRPAEAIPVHRKIIAITEKKFGPNHMAVAAALHNLGSMLNGANRQSEAEPFLRRALAIVEKRLGRNHPTVATILNTLAVLLENTNRMAEGERLLRRALAIDQNSRRADDPIIALRLNTLVQFLQDTNRLAEAEPLLRRAIAIYEKNRKPNDPTLAIELNNLALLLEDLKRPGEAEPLLRRALAIDEKSRGHDDATTAVHRNNLAILLATRQRWRDALAEHRRASATWIAKARRHQGLRGSSARRILEENAFALALHAQAAWHASGGGPGGLEEGWRMAQWALRTKVGEAPAQMGARLAKGARPLARIVRQRQDLLRARNPANERLLASLAKGNARSVARHRAALARLDRRIDGIDARLARDYPDYATIANPRPLSVAETQALLGPDEALVATLDMAGKRTIAGETFVWVVTRDEARWRRVELDTKALTERVWALRCGLDPSAWLGEMGATCQKLLGLDYGLADIQAARMPPFSVERAHALYNDLLAPFADLIRAKRLLVVASGPLTQLPFQVLVSAPPQPDAGAVAIADARWLIRDHAIAVLPSVASLALLRRHGDREHARKPFIGFGNPLLFGPSGKDRSALAAQVCPPDDARERVADRRIAALAVIPERSGLFRGALADVERVRQLEPLPETTGELCAVARSLGVSEKSLAFRVLLANAATETTVKRLSTAGFLARYRVVHFATHGLVADEARQLTERGSAGEPGLVLTPPARASKANDGLLSASEIAQLSLNADWVVLSACNTAAGGAPGAEALSGLASAFIYAGARSLLVTHWAIWSGAAVRLTTRTFAARRRDPALSRPEALRRAILSVIDEAGDDPRKAHPNYWAPFVLLGN